MIETTAQPLKQQIAVKQQALPGPARGRTVIQRKNINIDPMVDFAIFQAAFDKSGSAPAKLSEISGEFGIRTPSLQKIVFRQQSGSLRE